MGGYLPLVKVGLGEVSASRTVPMENNNFLSVIVSVERKRCQRHEHVRVVVLCCYPRYPVPG